ncbi:MAG TPA: hypothetical protein VJW73_20480 [Gemmatimonadaceae bacterium]|nr:hypothetical protein [Gemmatimonadaceae bacterium]
MLACIVQQPEGSELPFELGPQLVQDAPESVLDGLRLGEGPADGVLDEKTTVEVVAMLYWR